MSVWGVPSELRPSAGQLGQGGSRKHTHAGLSPAAIRAPFGLPDLQILTFYYAALCLFHRDSWWLCPRKFQFKHRSTVKIFTLPPSPGQQSDSKQWTEATDPRDQPSAPHGFCHGHGPPSFPWGGVPHGNTGTLTGHPGLDVHQPLGPGAQTQQRQHSDLKQNTSNVEDDALSRRRRLVIMHAHLTTAQCEEGTGILAREIAIGISNH
ncbi:hypothetical protein BP00DRAFT_275068 [Aspergillus indologenus CBS 114.80]|uniref:Uncharacterized protein n=1 Tax=Aspergillus indologenus CBS 114.80 TaxID=1450541 RepID=A0A2V5HU98_9EURO|nr:hypothetical protein BP00DRAFT_275068 [Aspergillus indologenus CBS 114.80]